MAEGIHGGPGKSVGGSALHETKKGDGMKRGVASNWLETLFEIIIGGLLRVLIPLVLFSLFALMILRWIAEDIRRWLRGKFGVVKQNTPEKGIANRGQRRCGAVDPKANSYRKKRLPLRFNLWSVLLEGGYAETGLRSRDPESRGLDPRADHIFSLEKALVWGGLAGMVLLFFLTLHLQQGIMQYIP